MSNPDSAREYESHEPVALRNGALERAVERWRIRGFVPKHRPKPQDNEDTHVSLLSGPPGSGDAKKIIDAPRALRSHELRAVLERFGFVECDD